MLKIIEWENISESARKPLFSRPVSGTSVQDLVQDIISAVQTRGDQALREFTREFDKQEPDSIIVSRERIANAEISAEAYTAIKTAINTITRYHEATMPSSLTVNTAPGITIQRLYRPIEKVGLYVPGGNNTPLISSLLMQAIPAKIAGCPVKVLCTPVNKTGLIDPHLLVAARLCNIDTIYQLGGAQAIAAMAYGSESVTKVDKLFGPGNSFVTEAKSQVAKDPKGAAIDMPAGPSEVMIVADNYANPEFIAADLLAQAEHGVDSQVFLLCESNTLARAVQEALAKQINTLSRQSVIKEALSHSAIIVCRGRDEQVELINNYAPEHLIINCRDAGDWVPDINAAGTIFLGQWAAETMGDYVTGSNHVLPTNGYAKSHSGLGTVDFLKMISVQSVAEEGIKTLGDAAATLARLEGLDAHANAIKIRLGE
ncbi:MAG: histidinol dehydrogenase [Legionella sp.]|nr:histidinol dehydrogenase [Legionella sp.]